MKITVNHQKNSLDYINKGDVITFEKEKNNMHDPKAIRAYYEEQFIGYVSVSGSTMGPATMSGHDIFDTVSDTFSGKVTDYADIISTKTGSAKIGRAHV